MDAHFAKKSKQIRRNEASNNNNEDFIQREYLLNKCHAAEGPSTKQRYKKKT